MATVSKKQAQNLGLKGVKSLFVKGLSGRVCHWFAYGLNSKKTYAEDYAEAEAIMWNTALKYGFYAFLSSNKDHYYNRLISLFSYDAGFATKSSEYLAQALIRELQNFFNKVSAKNQEVFSLLSFQFLGNNSNNSQDENAFIFNLSNDLRSPSAVLRAILKGAVRYADIAGQANCIATEQQTLKPTLGNCDPSMPTVIQNAVKDGYLIVQDVQNRTTKLMVKGVFGYYIQWNSLKGLHKSSIHALRGTEAQFFNRVYDYLERRA